MSNKIHVRQEDDGSYVFSVEYAAALNAAHDIAKMLDVRLGTDLGPVRERIMQAMERVEAANTAAPRQG